MYFNFPHSTTNPLSWMVFTTEQEWKYNSNINYSGIITRAHFLLSFGTNTNVCSALVHCHHRANYGIDTECSGPAFQATEDYQADLLKDLVQGQGLSLAAPQISGLPNEPLSWSEGQWRWWWPRRDICGQSALRQPGGPGPFWFEDSRT